MTKINNNITRLGAATRLALLAMGLAATGISTQVYAQLEEVVVTAQKRAESLQDVPISISALGKDVIEKTDTHGLADIALQVPGLSFTPFSPSQNIVSLRGAASNDDGAGTDGSVAVFVDDVYLGRISNINPEMFDLERIEVLRGPQGTLYGKNTIGGALNIVSTRPNNEEFEGKIRLNVGNYSRFDVAGLFTGPISKNWSTKFSFSRRKRSGWVYNPALGQDQKNDDTTAGRIQFLYEGDELEIMLSGDYNDLDVLDMGRVPLAADYNNNRGGANPASFRAGFEAVCGDVSGRDCVAGGVDGYASRTARGFSARVNRDIGDSYEFISITAWRESEADWNMDSSGSSLFLIDDILDDTDQFSQEFRVIGNVSDLWDFVAGFWYLRENTDRSECFDRSATVDCSVLAPVGQRNISIPDPNDPSMMVLRFPNQPAQSDYYRQDNETTSVALFANFNINFTEQWQLSVGARATQEEKEIENIAVAGDFVIINQTFQNERDESWTAFTPKVTARYSPWDHTNFYLTVAEGFKSGGFGAAPQLESDTEPLDQEEALNIEFGIKSEPTDTFRITAALYHTEYKGLQIQSFGPVPGETTFGIFRTFNAGDAEITGLDIESLWSPNESILLSWYVGIMDSEFGETMVPNSSFSNQDGQDMIRTPKLKYGFAFDYTVPFADGSKLTAGFNHSFVDDQRNELAPYAIQPSYRLWDARISWVSPRGSFEFTAWGKNMADEEYIIHLYTIANSNTGVYGEPRMYGLTGTFHF